MVDPEAFERQHGKTLKLLLQGPAGAQGCEGIMRRDHRGIGGLQRDLFWGNIEA